MVIVTYYKGRSVLSWCTHLLSARASRVFVKYAEFLLICKGVARTGPLFPSVHGRHSRALRKIPYLISLVYIKLQHPHVCKAILASGHAAFVIRPGTSFRLRPLGAQYF